MSASSVLFLNQYYPPDVASTGRFVAQIAAATAAAGTTVTVVCARPSYARPLPGGSTACTETGVRVIRLPLGPFRDRESLVHRVGGYVAYLCMVAVLGSFGRFGRPDVVVSFHNPPFLEVVAFLLSVRFRARFVFVAYDVHPDAIIESNRFKIPGFVARTWDLLNRVVLARADHVVVLGEGVRATLIERKRVPPARVIVIPPSAQPDLRESVRTGRQRARAGIPPEDLFVLSAGNMGVFQPIDLLIDAAVEVREEPITFVLLGGGVQAAALRKRVRTLRLQKVFLLPYLPEEAFADLVADSDLCVVMLRPGAWRLSVPSRAYTFLSAGRPLLTSMDAEADVARLVEEWRCGWNAADSRGIADILRDLVSDRSRLQAAASRARLAYEASGDQRRLLARYVAVILDTDERR